ncbi:MAG: radical SAM protein [Dehalococcoidales bacterium]|nr:MAG: radical SAM protein [Dehalococcoidales bacterium]
MRVLLISTPYPREENPLPPLSLTYLAGALERESIDVQIMDFLVARYHPQNLRRKLAEYRPQLVGITCVTMNSNLATRILKVCKDFDPNITTVMGGPHASFTPDETLLKAPWVNVIVIGEGETTLVELCRQVASAGDYNMVAGVAFVDKGIVVKTAPRPLLEDLDRLPLPARHLLPLSRYQALGVPCTITTSRGCPYGCIFCSAHQMFGRKVHFRSPGLVVDEIEMLYRDFGFTQINIVDDTFTVNHEHAGQVCEEILKRDLNISWSTYARVDNVTEDLVSLMRRAGCETVLFGIESSDENILETIRKGITPEDIRRGVRIACAAGFRVLTSFIFGLPGESPDTVPNTIAFADELNKNYGAEYAFHILAPMPGTELYEKASDYGLRFLTRNWANYDANRPVVELPTISKEAVKEAMASYEQAIEQVWHQIKCRAAEGDDQCKKTIDDIEARAFVWKVLQGDLIDKLGKITATDAADPVTSTTGLALRIAQKLDSPYELALNQIELLVQKGLISLVPAGKGARWQWSGIP